MPPRPFSFLLGAALIVTVPLVAGCGSGADAGSADRSSAASAPTADAATPRSGSAPDAPAPATSDDPNTVVVYKSPTCGCCEGWVEHLEANGFQVEAHDRTDLDQVKDLMGVPRRLRSCHTALVDDYLVEGHVPAATIRRLLADRPEVAGISVPGMPVGSPGMEVPGRPADPYDVLAFDGSGEVQVFEKH